MDKSKKMSQDLKFLITGAFLLAVVVTIVIWSFTFLVNNVLPAVTEDEVDLMGREQLHFDLEGFEELDL